MMNMDPRFSRKYQQRIEQISSCEEQLANLGKGLSPSHLGQSQHTLTHRGWGTKVSSAHKECDQTTELGQIRSELQSGWRWETYVILLVGLRIRAINTLNINFQLTELFIQSLNNRHTGYKNEWTGKETLRRMNTTANKWPRINNPKQWLFLYLLELGSQWSHLKYILALRWTVLAFWSTSISTDAICLHIFNKGKIGGG